MVKTVTWQKVLLWTLAILFIIGGSRYFLNGVGIALKNVGLLSVFHAQECPAEQVICQLRGKLMPLIIWKGNEQNLQKAEYYLRKSVQVDPEGYSAKIHLAEVLFSLGNRLDTIQLLRQVDLDSDNTSALFDDQRYEAQLMQAWEAYEREDWEQALIHFRLGLFWGGEHTSAVDEEAYLKTLANWNLGQAGKSLQEIDAKYKAGVFLAQAGDWIRATSYLTEVTNSNDPAILPQEKARAHHLLGRSKELDGNILGASFDYQKSFEIDPTDHDNLLRLIDNYTHLDKVDLADQLIGRLSEDGPALRLGIIGNEFQEERPALFRNGWKLIGYDTDENLLEELHRLEVILWWEMPENSIPPQDMIQIGDYWLQRQVITNLMPNPGMEWGVDDRGIPLGYEREGYGAPQGSITIVEAGVGDQVTHVLMAKNSPEVRQIALVSKEIWVDAGSLMLMAGWSYDQERMANIGRDCEGSQYIPGRPFFLGDSEILRPVDEWVHMASVAEPVPGKIPEKCHILILNFEASSEALWDKLVWARIKPGWIP
jgi:tetratricopeptide (TPR) repeat protein